MALTIVRIPNKGMMNFSQVPKLTSTMTREGRIKPVGVMNVIIPNPIKYALTTFSEDTPATLPKAP